MGFLDQLLGGGIDAKLEKLTQCIEEAAYDDAEERLLELRASAAKKYAPGSEVSVRLDLAEGKLRVKYHQFDRAESPVRRAFVAAKGLGSKDLLREAAEALLGCAARAGRHGETVELAEQWIAVASPDFRQRMDVLLTKGNALGQLGRFQDALKAFEASMRLAEAMPDTPDKHERFVTAASGMGDAFLGMDDRANAINSWRQAMAATRAQFGEDHPQVASILVCIGNVQLNADEIEPARGSFSQALEIFRAAGHGESVGAAVALQKLAMAQLMNGDHDRAATHAKEAIRVAGAHSAEMRAQAQDLLRKIEDAKRTPLNVLKAAPELALEEESFMSPMSLPQRPNSGRPAPRAGRSIINANWAGVGR